LIIEEPRYFLQLVKKVLERKNEALVWTGAFLIAEKWIYMSSKPNASVN